MTLLSCSTKKNTWGHRKFHETTTYYNGYFNGNEAIKEAEDALAASHKDDYYRILQVFPTGTLENSKSITPQADKATKKASFVIRKHSMYIKGKEYNKYMDDAYILLGKSNFYKRDYYAALEMFNYAVQEPLKNTKTDPAEYRAAGWLARTYNELGMYSDAMSALNRPLNDKNLSRKAKAIIYPVLADFYLKQRNYPKALEAVNQAIFNVKDRKFKRRLIFISAQLMQVTGKLKEASAQYKKVLKMSPPYEMAFYAKINIARSFENETGKSAEIRALLAKMLKDPKNADFVDQIYYTLGEVELKDDQALKAIDQYKKSVRASTVNSSQKGLSYLAIADIHFDWKEYRNSAVYYDSAASFVSKEHPDYQRVINKRKSLAELVQKYETITLYDSLLKLSGLSKEEIERRIDTLISQNKKRIQKEREEEKKREQMAQQSQSQQKTSSMIPGSGGMPGGNAQWYFYNPATMGFGFNEFKRVWGDRRLEDNWRRSNKQSLAPVAVNNAIDGSAEPTDKDSIPKLSSADSLKAARKKYADAIPHSDEMKKAYTDSVVNAWYDLGVIYKEQLGDIKEAIKVYEEFLKKYPGQRMEPTVMYQLYRLYLTLPDEKKADSRKAILLSKYPDSEYAKIIQDPDFFKSQQLSKKEADIYYAETYRLFKSGQYADALSRCRTAETKYYGNPLMPKFALLKALCIGGQKDQNAYRSALNDVVKNFPQDSVKKKASELLMSLDKLQGIAKPDSIVNNKPLFTYKGDTLHYYIVLIENRSMDLNDFKIALSNFNNEFYSLKNLQITSRLLGTNYQLVQVSPFENKKKAEEYLKSVDTDDALFNGMDMNIIDVFIISAGNYLTLVKEQKVNEYLEYYKKVYQ